MHKGCTRAACFNIAMIISLFLYIVLNIVYIYGKRVCIFITVVVQFNDTYLLLFKIFNNVKFYSKYSARLRNIVATVQQYKLFTFYQYK